MPETPFFTLQEDGGILSVIMNAPKNNLMTGEFQDEFEAVMEQVQARAAQGGVQGMILCGGGRHFCVGADVEALGERSVRDAYDDSTGIIPERHVIQKQHYTFLRELPFPVVAVVKGFCIGSGSEIALNCHYRIVEPGARIGQPESTFGILPALGGIARNIELCGMQKAYELVMTGRMLSSEEACEIGWGDILTEKKQGLAEANALIGYILTNCGTFDPAAYRRYLCDYRTSKSIGQE